jgi:hypothetical protein
VSAAAALSPAEALKVKAFGLDVPEGMEPVAAWKARTVALLRVQEQFSREEAARIRSHYDQGGLGAPGVSDVIRQEARAGAFASAVEIVEGMAL